MKKKLCVLLVALTLAGCNEQIDLESPVETQGVQESMPESRSRRLSKAVYNEALNAWMVPQSDPYTLDNFQVAYDKLAAGRSTQSLTKAQVAEFGVGEKLSPTHYALKVYPRNEKEQWHIEKMDDVGVSYHPFNYAVLTQEEVEKLPKTRTELVGNSFEKSPYTVTYEGYISAEGNPVDTQISRLPILYAVWPISKPLPDDLEYIIDYEVFLPKSAIKTRKAEILNILENEAVSAAFGVSPVSIKPSTRDIYVSGTAKNFDNCLGKNVPMSNLKVSYWNGSDYVETYTSDSGYFRLNFPNNYYSSHLLLSFEFIDKNKRWKITVKGGSYTLVCSNYETTFKWGPGVRNLGDVVLQAGSANEIHRAVNYYYNNQTEVPRFDSECLRIEAYSANESRDISWAGLFANRGDNNYYIAIANLGYYNPDSDEPGGDVRHADVIGTTLHELGHYVHFKQIKAYDFNLMNTLLIEAFSTYSGWYFGREYYKSLGWHGGSPDLFLSQSRQYWHKNYAPSYSIRFYSPLLVDLTDTYNQRTYYSNALNDEIRDIAAQDIWNIVSTCKTWNIGPYREQYRYNIENYAGRQPGFSAWISDFDEWFSRPENQTNHYNQIEIIN